ncbi:MAG TPA: NAD-dependent epimerase/dehydratase family protein [Caulobacteraceae bacterium]|jgi:nucleoside-diphosphate-sugar epimerase|nr:NAD-dependent epimerase/dehydratase family protein [Caulobacteraceae bacterium]
MKTALIVGGSGQIGQATARNLLAHGWRVRLAQRHRTRLPEDLVARVELVSIDREQSGAVAGAVAGGVDALIDTVAYDEAHARQLLAVQGGVGAFVVISSGSVCRDEAGRTLDEAADTGFPEFPVPLTEDQSTVAPGPETYSTRKAALEQTLLQEATGPVTIVRPFAIHGPGSTHPREWWFVKRILDGRRRIPLALRGESRFHTSASVNIAELIRVALETPATQILNAADPDAPSVAEIGRAVAEVYGVELDLVLLDGPPKGGVGATPWGIPRPIIADTSRAAALGYRPVATYSEAIGAACRSAEALAAAGVPFAPYLAQMFDYAAEDVRLAQLS